MRQGFLLCAQMRGDVWLCHPGTLTGDDGAICSKDPFDVNDLAVRDIVADRFDACPMPRKRIRHRVNVNLHEAAAAHPREWSQIRALALWKAEELRTESGHIDIARASVGFEKNPFRWNCEGRLSQIKICFVWSWCSRQERHEHVFVHANNLFKKRGASLCQKR